MKSKKKIIIITIIIWTIFVYGCVLVHNINSIPKKEPKCNSSQNVTYGFYNLNTKKPYIVDSGIPVCKNDKVYKEIKS